MKGNISKNGGFSISIHSSILFLSLIFLFIMASVSFSEPYWVPFYPEYPEGTPPEINILENSLGHTLIEIIIPGMWVEEFTSPESFVFKKLIIPEYATTNDKGLPEIPAIRGMLGIPPEACSTIEVVSTENIILDDYLVYPYQRPAPEEEGYIPEFEIDWDFYNSDVWYPENIVEVGGPDFFKELWVSDIEVIPFEYNPYQRELNVNKSMTVNVEYSGGKDYVPELEPSPQWIDMYEEFIWNFENPGIKEGPPPNSHYVIITPDNYYYE
ncbi:MAG: C25 family peptidase propeptide domain-containing protein [bacterium]